ncbi:hypothetical protein ES703_70944 [subsurface metagenome]
MIRVYFLPVEIIDHTEVVAGTEFIHDALLECTENPEIRKLIQDTTEDDHNSLVAVCHLWTDATPEEIDLYNATVTPEPPDPDADIARDILSTHPGTIEPPALTTLIRIYAKRLGIT